MSVEIQKQNEIDRMVRKMDMAEAVNAANVGSQPDRQHRNSKSFTRWLDSIVRKINKLQNRKVLTIWDNIKRSKRL
jgi:hypothetical protein